MIKYTEDGEKESDELGVEVEGKDVCFGELGEEGGELVEGRGIDVVDKEQILFLVS